MACCPTLLATIEQDLPQLRILLVGGEACPQNLVARWYRPGRRILNSYGPTEATVTATLTELKPDKPVTIGVPLPTYSIVILDPAEDKAVAPGELGEIGIAGVGLALGYLNRDELTLKKFIRDFLDIQNNPSGRIYRTGDLGRINENGEIEYRGRIDTQVKIRGYRIELNEIEAVLLDLPQIAQAAVTTFEPEPGSSSSSATTPSSRAPTCRATRSRRRCAASCRPTWFRPFSRSCRHPDDAQQQGRPQEAAEAAGAALLGRARATCRRRPRTSASCTHALAEVLRVERVSTEDHFFDDLGAQFAADGALLREDPQESRACRTFRCATSTLNPTIAKLARHLDSAIERISSRRSPSRSTFPSNLAYYACGALQLVFYAAYALFGLWVLDTGYQWASAARRARSRSTRAASLSPRDRSSR